jgi:hypothetical protein
MPIAVAAGRVTLAAVSVAALACASPAGAAPGLRVDVERPVAEAPALVRVTVPVAGRGSLEVRHRSPSGRPCARVAADDPGARVHRPWAVEGPVVTERVYAFPAAGPMRVCAWLRRPRGPVLRGGAEVVVAPADGALRLLAPVAVARGRAARVVVAGEAPVPRRAYLRARPAGAGPCGPTYAGTAGRGLLQNAPVLGAFRRVVTWTPPRRGRWVLCAWLARGGADPGGLAVDAELAAGVPPRAPATAIRLDIGDGGPPYRVVATLSSPAGTPGGRCLPDLRIPAGWDRLDDVAVDAEGRCTVVLPAGAGRAPVVRVRYLPADARWRPVSAVVAIPPV